MYINHHESRPRGTASIRKFRWSLRETAACWCLVGGISVLDLSPFLLPTTTVDQRQAVSPRQAVCYHRPPLSSRPFSLGSVPPLFAGATFFSSIYDSKALLPCVSVKFKF